MLTSMLAAAVILNVSFAFSPIPRTIPIVSSSSSSRIRVSMEYIPDGFSKDQWKALKKKEEEDLKAKGNLGALGTTKFKSRSFEAWQKSGGKHLFPVDPNTTPYEERPYMQRKDGDWEGNDLKKKGLKGVGQGTASTRTKLDDLYATAEKEGRLNSASFFGSGLGLDWTGKGDKKNFDFNPDGKQGARPAGKQLSAEETERLKKNLAKVKVSKKEESVAAAPNAKETPKKKGLFGLF